MPTVRHTLVIKTALFATVCICIGYTLGLIQGMATSQPPIQVDLCDAPPDPI